MTDSSSKRVHEVLEKGKEALKSEFGHLAMGTCLIDAHDHLIWANHAFSAMLGYSERQISKMCVSQITHAQDLKANSVYKRRLQTGADASLTFEERFIHKDGHVVWTAVTVSPVRYTDLDSLCFLNFVQDITNGTLAACEVRFRRLFETARDGILILDTDSLRITDVNPATEELLGYSREHLLGRRLGDTGLFQDAETFKNVMETLQRDESARCEQLTLRSKSGMARDVELIGNAYEIDGKRAIQCIIRDMEASRCLKRYVKARSASE